MHQSLAADQRLCVPCWGFAFRALQRAENLTAAGRALAEHQCSLPLPLPSTGDLANACTLCLGPRATQLRADNAGDVLASLAMYRAPDEPAGPEPEQVALSVMWVPGGNPLLALPQFKRMGEDVKKVFTW